MGLQFKIDVLAELKSKGFSTYVIRRDKIMGTKTVEEIKKGKVTGTKTIETICELLKVQPGEILEYIPDTQDN